MDKVMIDEYGDDRPIKLSDETKQVETNVPTKIGTNVPTEIGTHLKLEKIGINGQPINTDMTNFKVNDSITEKAFNIMAKEFKVNNLVEVPMWPDEIKRNWIITGFASNGGEAILRNIFTKEQTFIFVSKLKHQKKEGSIN